MAASRGRWSVAGWAGVAIGLTALAFWFVIGAFFWADDFLNLYEIVNGDVGEFVLRMHGGHLLLVRNVVAVLSFHAFGPQPAGYFFLAFLTHLVNALLLFRVVLTTCVVAGPLCDPDLYPGTSAYAMVTLYTLAVVAVLVRGPGTARRHLLAVLVFAAAAYGIIAAGRGIFRTPENAMWMARTPRFHYLGLMPLTIGICLALARLGDRLRPRASWTTAALLACVVVSAWNSVRTTIMTRPSPGLAARTETTRALAAMQTAIDTAAPGEDVYIENRPLAAAGPMLQRSPELFPGWAGLFAIHFPANVVDGHRIFFIESNARVIAATKAGRRTAGLLVARRPTR